MMNERIPYLREKTAALTGSPGVYIMKQQSGQIIYIGKAKNLKKRVTSYFCRTPNHTPKVAKMVSQVYDYDYIVTDSEYEALVLECSLIKQHKPKYNILLKDDKGYFYIKISDPPYPKITAEKQNTRKDGVYLGPYTSSFVTRETVDEVNRVFKLPTCHRRFPQDFRKQRPCLNYHINQCMGLCRGKVDAQTYRALIDEAVAYIRSGSEQSVERLTAQMEAAAEQLQFERAAQLRDRIKAIRKAGDSQKIIDPDLADCDLIAAVSGGQESAVSVLMYRNGRLADKASFTFHDAENTVQLLEEFVPQFYRERTDIPRYVLLEQEITDQELLAQLLTEQAGHPVHLETRQRGDAYKRLKMAKNNAAEAISLGSDRTAKELLALEELARLLGMEKPPLYIEAYDISNLSSTAMVAGMVVFENGRPLKKAYKRFSVRESQIQNDYACMHEVLERRFREYKAATDEGFARLPDLILLDGGKGQVNAVTPVLRELGIHVPVYGMVKDNKHRTRAIAYGGGEISMNSRQAAFQLLTRIQDEVHRFSVAYMHSRHKHTFGLSLTQIRGIGEKKAQKLILTYKTKEALKAASRDALAKTAGVTGETADALYQFIQEM